MHPRIFVFSGARSCDSIAVFDVWNPDSVDVASDSVQMCEREWFELKRCCGLGSRDTPCIVCSCTSGRLFICDECLYDEELGMQE